MTADASEVTLFSMSVDRQSVDTWFEVDLPFRIEPSKACLSPADRQLFTVTFSPLDAFDFKVKLKSTIGTYRHFTIIAFLNDYIICYMH